MTSNGNNTGGGTLATPAGLQQNPNAAESGPLDEPAPDKNQIQRSGLDVRLIGPVTVYEPDAPPTPLDEDRYLIAQGTRFETGESRAAGLCFPQALLFRLDQFTDATIGPEREASVETGRIWISAVGPERQRLDTPFGSLEVGKGVLMVTIGDARADVLVLSGDVAARPSAGAERLVRSGRWFVLREDRVTDERDAGFTGTATSWMTEFVVLQLDPTERIARAEQMVQALTDDRYRAEARLEILRLGAYAVPSLMRLAPRPSRPSDSHRRRRPRTQSRGLLVRKGTHPLAHGRGPRHPRAGLRSVGSSDRHGRWYEPALLARRLGDRTPRGRGGVAAHGRGALTGPAPGRARAVAPTRPEGAPGSFARCH